MKKIANESIRLERQTRTDLALEMANDTLYTAAGGDRPDKPNVMIVLTDGKPTHPGKDFDFKAFSEEISKDFKVGINLSFTFLLPIMARVIVSLY